jgi:hypothetical protein
MTNALDARGVKDGDRVDAVQIPAALTAALLRYQDGSTQTFAPDGTTRYIEHDQTTRGEWHVDEQGRFCSFWPPSYRACYDLAWIVEYGLVVGLRFADVSGGPTFVGRYEHPSGI